MNRPQQHTDLLMLPVEDERADQLTAPPAWSNVGVVAIELLLGVAAITNERKRQHTAARVARAIFAHMQESKIALQNFVAEVYERRERSKD